jgi:hypothetical protein
VWNSRIDSVFPKSYDLAVFGGPADETQTAFHSQLATAMREYSSSLLHGHHGISPNNRRRFYGFLIRALNEKDKHVALGLS